MAITAMQIKTEGITATEVVVTEAIVMEVTAMLVTVLVLTGNTIMVTIIITTKIRKKITPKNETSLINHQPDAPTAPINQTTPEQTVPDPIFPLDVQPARTVERNA